MREALILMKEALILMREALILMREALILMRETRSTARAPELAAHLRGRHGWAACAPRSAMSGAIPLIPQASCRARRTVSLARCSGRHTCKCTRRLHAP